MLFFLYNFLKVVGKFKVLSWKKKELLLGSARNILEQVLSGHLPAGCYDVDWGHPFFRIGILVWGPGKTLAFGRQWQLY